MGHVEPDAGLVVAGESQQSLHVMPESQHSADHPTQPSSAHVQSRAGLVVAGDSSQQSLQVMPGLCSHEI